MSIWSRLRERRRRRGLAREYPQTMIAFQVRLLRLSRAMTRSELATAAGLSRRVLARIENPEDAGDYDLGALTRIAEVFDVALLARFVSIRDAVAQADSDVPPTFDEAASPPVVEPATTEEPGPGTLAPDPAE